MMEKLNRPNRRTVLKTGLAAVGGSTIIGTASAHEPENRRHDSFTWANDVVYEMLEAEPGLYGKSDMVNPEREDEGNHKGQRPIWVKRKHPTDQHSPHPAPGNPPIDHVIDLTPGKQFYSAQWHIHLILDPDVPFICIDHCKEDDPEDPVLFPNFSGPNLTSASKIRTAIKNGDVMELPTEAAFTCPVRPHHD